MYEITDVPALMAVTTPPDDMVHTVELLLFHEPPPVASASVLVAPAQADVVPVMALGASYTVTVLVL